MSSDISRPRPVAQVLTLTGPSTGGKSTVLAILQEAASRRFRPFVIKKFTTRPSRTGDGEEIECVEKIPDSCNLVYEQYGVRYGLELPKIFAALERGEAPIVILNDIRTVEDIRSLFGPLVTSLYVFRQSPSLERFLASAAEREASDEDEYIRRFKKAEAIHRIYIENIQVFDSVILNVSDLKTLRRQVRQILSGIFARVARPLR
jgi:guanylate kinase